MCVIYINNQANLIRIKDLSVNPAVEFPRIRSYTFLDISLESSEFLYFFPLIVFTFLLKLPTSPFQSPSIS